MPGVAVRLAEECARESFRSLRRPRGHQRRETTTASERYLDIPSLIETETDDVDGRTRLICVSDEQKLFLAECAAWSWNGAMSGSPPDLPPLLGIGWRQSGLADETMAGLPQFLGRGKVANAGPTLRSSGTGGRGHRNVVVGNDCGDVRTGWAAVHRSAREGRERIGTTGKNVAFALDEAPGPARPHRVP